MKKDDIITDYSGILVWIALIVIGILIYLVYRIFKKK
jgi:lipoprotein signal peptidase